MADLFKHLFIDNQSRRTLVLLHGTGGDEHDLIPLVSGVKQHNILSLRGNVIEQGMNRFFARTAPGVFDQESIQQEADKLAEFMSGWRKQHRDTSESIVYLGYSNGANMILALTALHPKVVERAVLLHPMMPVEVSPALNLTHKEFLVTMGANDPIIPASQGIQVVKTLEHHGATVTPVTHKGGHEIRSEEIVALVDWLPPR